MTTSAITTSGDMWISVDDLVTSLQSGAEGGFDCIVVLGGGVPLGPSTQLPFVANRCAAAVDVRSAHHGAAQPAILCLSAGTAHAAQLLSPAGLPVWEATVSAAECLKRGVPSSHVFVETTSYDTIGNAFFARTSHTDHAGWRKLLVITSAFHVERSKAIFDWIFSLPGGVEGEPYSLSYLATPDDGLSPRAVEARAAREAKSARTVREVLSVSHRSLGAVHAWISRDHDLYAAHKLAERASDAGAHVAPALLASYGGGGYSAAAPRSAKLGGGGNLGTLLLMSAAAGAAAALLVAGFLQRAR